MNKINKVYITMVVAMMMVVCSGDVYAYKANEETMGHRHITTQAKNMFLDWYPESKVKALFEDSSALLIQDLPDDVRTKADQNYFEILKWGLQHEDEYDPIYELHDPIAAVTTTTHFWDADEGALEPTKLASFQEKPNSWVKAALAREGASIGGGERGGDPLVAMKNSYWDQAIEAWEESEAVSTEDERVMYEAEAFERLGHVAHLMQDMTLPVHAHEDQHGPTGFLGNLDAYEEWSSQPFVDRSLVPTLLTIMTGLTAQLITCPQPADVPFLSPIKDLRWDGWFRPWAMDTPLIPLENLDYTEVPVEWINSGGIPDDRFKPELFYLFYTANQYGDYYHGFNYFDGLALKHGDDVEDTGWLNYDDLGLGPADAIVTDFSSWPFCGFFEQIKYRDPRVIAKTNYYYAIRATATLFQLFFQQVGVIPLTVLVCPPDITDLECGLPISPDITGLPVLAESPNHDVAYDDDVSDLDDLGLGTVIRTWSATSELTGPLTQTCEQLITIVDTTGPVTICPGDRTVECTATGGTPKDDGQLVTFFTGVSATDLCDANPEIIDDAPGFFPLGNTTVEFTATDGSGNSSMCSDVVTVADTTPPDITNVTADPNVLWPPNHEMNEITVEITATDVCDDTPTCMIDSVSSNEPINGKGSGNTSPDWEITGDFTVDLRAERSGKGDGRVYTITVACIDDSGNISEDSVNVTVPHSKVSKRTQTQSRHRSAPRRNGRETRSRP